MVTESNCLTNTWHPSKEVTLSNSDEINTEELITELQVELSHHSRIQS